MSEISINEKLIGLYWDVKDGKVHPNRAYTETMKAIKEEVENKWVHKGSDSYWSRCGRNNREYYHVDYYFCEKTLEERKVEKRHSCYDQEVWDLPQWAKSITKKINGCGY